VVQTKTSRKMPYETQQPTERPGPGEKRCATDMTSDNRRVSMQPSPSSRATLVRQQLPYPLLIKLCRLHPFGPDESQHARTSARNGADAGTVVFRCTESNITVN
jgi:hypothetical protein